MELKLVMIDLDETLLRSDKTYDRESFDAILDEFNRQGILLCICTGNSYHKIKDYFDDHALEGVYFACDNGNYIVKNNETLRVIGIDQETSESVVGFLDDFDGYHVNYSTGKLSYIRNREGQIAIDYIRRYNNNVELVDSFYEIPEGIMATKLAIFTNRSLEEGKSLIRIINNMHDDIQAVTSGDGWVDIYNQAGGKGSAARYLMDKYAIKPDQVMAFGDSLNDESMMEEVHYSVAMGNADPDLVLSCRYQIGTNDEDAVIKTLQRYLQEGSLDFIEAARV